MKGSPLSPTSRALTVAIAIALVGFVMVAVLTKRFPPKTNTTTELNGLTYTVMQVSHTSSIGITEGKDGTSHLIVDLKMRNPKPVTVTHDAEFQILDSKGLSYDLDDDATPVVNHSDSWPKSKTFKFEIMPKLSKFVTLVFPVPKKSLNSTWTLLIQNKNDKTLPGMIKVGSPTKVPAQD